MVRILGIDIGDRRVGVAISDELGLTAQPLETLDRKADTELADTLKEMAAENKASRVVIGLPLSLDGSVGESARKVLDFVEMLKKKTGLEVLTWDERFTSLQAEKLLIGFDVSRKKRKAASDRMAAVLILQAYLDWRHKEGV